MTWYLLQVKTVHSYHNSADTQLILRRGNVIMILSHEYLIQGYNMVKLIPFNFLLDLVVPALVSTAIPCVPIVEDQNCWLFQLGIRKRIA